jgi:hypothetical protein
VSDWRRERARFVFLAGAGWPEVAIGWALPVIPHLWAGRRAAQSWNVMGRMPMPRHDEALLLFLSAPLRLCVTSLFPSSLPHVPTRPRVSGYPSQPFFADPPGEEMIHCAAPVSFSLSADAATSGTDGRHMPPAIMDSATFYGYPLEQRPHKRRTSWVPSCVDIRKPGEMSLPGIRRGGESLP